MPRAPQGGVPAKDIIDRVLALVCFELEMDVAYVGRFAPGRLELPYLEGDGEPFGLAPGGAVPLGRTYCARMASGLMPSIVRDTHAEPATAGLEFTHALNMRAYAGVAIRLPDERPVGTIACLSSEPRPKLSSRNTDLLRLVGRHVGAELERRANEARGAIAPESDAERMPLILRGITSELSGSSFGGRLVDMPLYRVNAVLSGRDRLPERAPAAAAPVPA